MITSPLYEGGTGESICSKPKSLSRAVEGGVLMSMRYKLNYQRKGIIKRSPTKRKDSGKRYIAARRTS